ncbi:MAG: N-acetylglucosamine kinase [Planctomycetaceae bacterium]
MRGAIGDGASPPSQGGAADSALRTPRSALPLLLAIEGGGTKTVAWLAALDADGEPRVLGRGTAGPSNVQAIGSGPATQSVAQAVQSAWDDARRERSEAAAACLALAGADRPADRALWEDWSRRCGLAERVEIVNDALPVLAAGTPQGWGVALIAGTGSFAYGRAPDGATARTGGWGHLMGDEGSAYSLALAGLRAATRCADGRGPETALLAAFLQRLNLTRGEELIPAIYHPHHDRRRLAALADVVTAAATAGDAVALDILHAAAEELAELVATTARKIGLLNEPLPLALAGGLLLNTPLLREDLLTRLAQRGVSAAPVTPVAEPIRGVLRLASRNLARR